MAAAEGVFLAHLALVPLEGLGSHRIITVTGTVLGKLPPSGCCPDSGLKHTRLCKRSWFACPRAPAGGTASGLAHKKSAEMLSSNMECPLMLIHSSGALIFASAVQRTPPDHLALVAVRTDAGRPTGMHRFAYFMYFKGFIYQQ